MNHHLSPRRESDRKEWPRTPLPWIQPRLGWISASPQKRTPQKRKLAVTDSEQTTEPNRALCEKNLAENVVAAKLDLQKKYVLGGVPVSFQISMTLRHRQIDIVCAQLAH